MKSDVARFTTHVRTCQQPDLVQDRSDEGGKKRNVVFQLVLQQCCKASCTFFVPRFSVPYVVPLWVNVLNRPLALRGHVTNASFRQWVGILLMPKIDRADKNYLTPEIWEDTHLREIFHGTLIFQQSSIICFGRHVGGHTLALQNSGRNYFSLISC